MTQVRTSGNAESGGAGRPPVVAVASRRARREALPPMTQGELFALPPTVDLRTAARALGIGRNVAYNLARAGESPVRLLRLGVQYRVLTSDLWRVLGVDVPAQ